jgi:hypothetical protein
MISNNVLEWAQVEVEKERAKYIQAGKPVPDELELRKQQVELRLNLLILQVQTGQLSVEAYTGNKPSSEFDF